MNARATPTATDLRVTPPQAPPDDHDGPGVPPPSKPPLFPVVAGLALLLGAGVLAFSLLGIEGTSATGGRPPGSADKGLPLVSVATVRAEPFTVTNRVAGVVSAAKQATLRARVSGPVAQVNTTLGATVKEGALLVALDAGTLLAELERARAAAQVAVARLERAGVVLDDATAEVERRERLVSQGAAAGRTRREATTARDLAAVDKALAEAEVRRAQADVEIMRVRVEQTRTRAPFTGRISSLDVDVGEDATAGGTLLTMVSEGPPRVHFGLSESAARALAVGDVVAVDSDDGEATATVERIGAGMSITDHVRQIEAVFPPEQEGKLLVGAFAEVEVGASVRDDTPLVPLLALRGRGSTRQAFVVGEGGVVKEVDVMILLEDGTTAAVTGLSVGDVVIKAGGGRLKDGDKVQVLK